jgi:mono/diheme cytochrome c family protein
MAETYRPRHLLMRRAIPIALLAAIPVAVAVAGAPGAPGARKPGKPAKAAAAGKLTFARDIAPIIQSNCATCHRPGEVAPFSLLSYEDVTKRAKQIAAVTKSRFMPPWKAESHGEFLDERRLTDSQIQTIADWAESGAPMGDPKEMPAPPKFRSGWKLGEPDKVIGMPEPFSVPAESNDIYRCFVVPTEGQEDKFLSTIEVHPGNRTVVHHVIAYVDTNGAARKLDEKDPGPGYTTHGGGPGFIPSGFLGGWAPGNESRHLPAGVGNFLPKGSDIVLEVHYHPTGKPETDNTQVGLYYAKGPISKRVRMLPVINPFFKIPAGAEDHVVNAGAPVLQDITVLGVTPHMHLLGRSMKVTATLPDKATKPIVNVPDWDFNWQITYAYKEPLKLPAGSTVNLVARYDNSTKNPRNPNKKPRDVTWGEQTTDEMCIAFLGYTVDAEDLTKPKKSAAE